MRKHFAYYNEFDPNAAAWLRELITLGAIMDGEVDERSITDVRADDLDGFTRCHFFAGIGGWDLALRRAGWRDDVPVWTGSCPCQDFSCAGKQKGFEGKRDLWPAFHNLIRQRRPELVFGEQVKNAVRHGWLDRLYADLEGEGYACGSVVLGAHSAGADHIRQRIYWMADSSKRGGGTLGEAGEHGSHRANGAGGGGIPDRLADAQHAERRPERPEHTEPHGRDGLGGSGVSRGLADSERDGRNERRAEREGLGGSAAPVGRSAVGGVADLGDKGLQGRERNGAADAEGRPGGHAGECCGACRMGDTSTIGPEMRDGVHGELHGQGSGEGRDLGRLADSIGDQKYEELGRPEGDEGKRGSIVSGGCGVVGGVADAIGERGRGGESRREDASDAWQSGQTSNFWSDARPHLCKDGKWRRFEPRIFPLVAKPARAVGHCGDPRLAEYADQTSEARVMRLKGYGNCICVDTAVLFIEAVVNALERKETT